MEKILVTGASGFIGSNLVRELARKNNKVKILIRESTHPFLKNLNIDMNKGDITDFKSIKKAMKCCDYVYHCAARISFSKFDYENSYKVNVLGTRNVLKAAIESNIEKLVHVSSAIVYGTKKDRKTFNEDVPLIVKKENVYAYTKYLAEREVEKAWENGLNASIVRPTTVYGQGDINLNSGSLIKSIYQNKVKFAPPGGANVISVDDIVNGLMLTMENGKKCKKYILGGYNYEFIKIFNMIAEVVGSNKIRLVIPKMLYYPAYEAAALLETFSYLQKKKPLMSSEIIKDSFCYKFYDNKKTKKELKWNLFVDFKTAVSKAFKFYKEQGLM